MKVRVGDKVRVRVGSEDRIGYVTRVLEDVKNGRPGIEYDRLGQKFWAYTDQIVSATR